MAHIEKTLSSNVVYDGRIIKVLKDDILLENGDKSIREIIEHPGAVGIVPIDGKGDVILVRQYRYAVGAEMLEIPAGKMEYGEDPLECAVRELSEETGYEAGKIVHLGSFYPSVGVSREKLHMYLATELKKGEAHPDVDEFVDVVTMPFDEAVDMAMKGQFNDGKSIIGLL
ncbi:MAG: NUDIX hydrolase, partial [Oscillospiraceae bacterium]|nr:NUDIX hydrolase [Oscillospiraceae bacterium]